MSDEVPTDIGELSNWAFDQAIGKLRAYLNEAPDDVRAALAVVDLVSQVPRRTPWYGIPIDPEDSSVTVGVMMRNAFESVGDWVDALASGGVRVTKADNWFTRHYMDLWRSGRAAWYDYLDHFNDPLWYQEQYGRQTRSDAEYAAQQRRLGDMMRSLDADLRPRRRSRFPRNY